MALFVAFGGLLFISGVSLVFLLVYFLRYAEFLQCSWFCFRRVLGSALPEVCNRPGSSRGPRGDGNGGRFVRSPCLPWYAVHQLLSLVPCAVTVHGAPGEWRRRHSLRSHKRTWTVFFLNSCHQVVL